MNGRQANHSTEDVIFLRRLYPPVFSLNDYGMKSTRFGVKVYLILDKRPSLPIIPENLQGIALEHDDRDEYPLKLFQRAHGRQAGSRRSQDSGKNPPRVGF
jgi:hypothetical protein